MNFFYSININDRIRFPILGELKQDPLPSDLPMAEEVEKEGVDSEKDNAGCKLSDKVEEDSYFSVFKHANYEKGLYCDEILKFLDGFFQNMRMGGRMRKGMHSLQSFLDAFSSYVHANAREFRELMDTMNTKRLITPYIELDLPVHIIEEFNQLEEDDPRINLYQLNPVWGTAIKEFGFFWERYESTKEVLCMFVWSTIDHAVVPMPAVGLNPYPLCWVCDKGFGTLACNKCKVAKYCSKECQQQDWIQHGGPVCDLMASSLRRVKQLTFKRPPSPSPPAKKQDIPPPSYSPTPPPSHSPSPSPPPSSSSPSLSPSLSPPQSPPTHPSSPPLMELDYDDPPFAIMEHI